MNATELIKHIEVRRFLLDNFPKPVVNQKKIFPEIVSTENKNPSLTGNAFEIFLRLLSAKTKNNIKEEFDSEKEIAFRNLEQTHKSSNEEKMFKDYIRIELNKSDYENKVEIIKKILNKKKIPIKETIEKFKFSRVEMINDISILSQVLEKTNLLLRGHYINWFLYKNEDVLRYYIILDKNSFADFIDTTIKKIETESSIFIQKRELNKNFVELILEFTQISSQFFRSIDVVKGFHFEESYVNYVFELFNIIYRRKDIYGKTLLHHPSLKCSGILATPDFLIEDKILEIKTSKEFFSTEDYLQALAYLLLAHDSQNKKRWGVIKEAEIFYPVFDTSVKIKMKEDDDRIKPALKFLKKYSTDEPKTRLKQLKAQMFKEQKKKK